MASLLALVLAEDGKVRAKFAQKGASPGTEHEAEGKQKNTLEVST